MENKFVNKADVANETAVTINRNDFTLGTATGLDAPLGIQRPALSVGFNETLSYFFSEYFKGLLFLAFSIFPGLLENTPPVRAYAVLFATSSA